MSFLQAIVFGVVEGLTEFLPVSSTFHLILTSRFFGLPQTDFLKLFEVAIQSGAIISVLVLYGRDLWRDRTLLKNIGLSFIPTALVGFVLYKIIKTFFFESTELMTAAFIIMGLVFLMMEGLVAREEIILEKEISRLTVCQALLIGLAQALAVIPGVSRAGAVMVFMMLLGYKRGEAARYSFLLAVPTILAASVYDFWKMRDVVAASSGYSLLLVGWLAALVFAYLVMRWFLRYLQSHTLLVFGWYRLIAGIVLILL